MYNLLKRKYILTKSKKHKYDKREYIMFLNEDDNYKSIVDEIFKKRY